MKGFTIVEILLVVAIISFLLFLTAPWGISFYKTQQLDTTADGIIQALRRAQLKAMAVENDSSFGVYIEEGQYRLEDEVFKIPQGISTTGLSEVIFSKLAGLPSNTGKIILTSDSEQIAININEIGVASLRLPVSHIAILRPEAPPGDETQLRTSNCSENWDCLDEENSDDDSTYVYARRNENRSDLYNLPDPNISQDNTIFQLTVYFRCRRSGSATKTAASYLKTNNQTDTRPSITLTDNYQLYSEVYPNNPITTNPWTPDEIDNLQIGLNLVSSGDWSDRARCTQVWAEVNYTSF